MSGGTDPKYDAMIAEAGVSVDRRRRFQMLAQSESYFLRAMPIVPLSTFVFPLLAKPFVKFLSSNLLDRQQFKHVWIDQNRRPQ